MADITISVPKFTAVSLTPNPASTNQSIVISATVTEETKVLTPFPFTGGEISSGET